MKQFNLIIFFIALSLITASFDLFLNVQLGGFSFKVTQMTMSFAIFFSFIYTFFRGKGTLPLGFPALLLWSFFMILFIPHTTFIERNILYVFWLMFSILSIYALVQLVQSRARLELILKIYVLSFAFVAIFGFMQFAAGFFGINLLTAQWYVMGRFARINGFSYEPSYFATYLLTGFVLTSYLIEKRSSILPRRLLIVCFYLIFIAIMLSTSRMGWLLAWFWYSRPFLFFIGHLLRGRIHRIYFKQVCKRTIIPLFLGCLAIYVMVEVFSIRFFISGLGIMGDGGHSSHTRWNDFTDLLTIFSESPLIGYSLGGVSSALGALYNKVVLTNATAKMYEGVGIFAQVLVASGLIGVIPFIVYMYQIIIKPIQLARKTVDKEMKTLLIGMVWSLVFLLAILQFSPTILRPYLWLHIALLCSCYAITKKTVNLAKNKVYC